MLVNRIGPNANKDPLSLYIVSNGNKRERNGRENGVSIGKP